MPTRPWQYCHTISHNRHMILHNKHIPQHVSRWFLCYWRIGIITTIHLYQHNYVIWISSWRLKSLVKRQCVTKFAPHKRPQTQSVFGYLDTIIWLCEFLPPFVDVMVSNVSSLYTRALSAEGPGIDVTAPSLTYYQSSGCGQHPNYFVLEKERYIRFYKSSQYAVGNKGV